MYLLKTIEELYKNLSIFVERTRKTGERQIVANVRSENISEITESEILAILKKIRNKLALGKDRLLAEIR